MKFLFIDETERQRSGSSKDFFCLCGLIINDDLVKLEDDLNEFASEMGHIKNFKEIRGADKLPRDIRLIITDGIYEILDKHGCKVISIILGKTTIKRVSNFNNIYTEAFDFLIERFYMNIKNNEGGMVIFDKINDKAEKNLRKKFFEYVSDNQHTMFGWSRGNYRDRIFKSVLFSGDEYCRILQATDLIATALGSAFHSQQERKEINLEKLNEENKYIGVYFPLFKKSSSGKVNGYGIKIWG